MKTLKIKILTAFIVILSLSAQAQILAPFSHTPAQNLPGPIPVTNATNTGNASTDFFGELVTASVCDGFRPRINVIHGPVNVTATIGASLVGISDPDVVTFPPVVGDDHVDFYVVYERFGEILAQDWAYDPVAGTLTPGIIETIATGGCSNPNIDAVDRCGIGIVYERGGEIFGRFGSLGDLCPTASFPSNLNAEMTFSTCTPSGNSEPDIALYHDGIQNLASIVYIHNTGIDESVVLQRHTIDDFINANPVDCADNQELKSVPVASESLHTPRIASVNADPTWVDPRAPGDCQIVVEHRFAGSGYEILGFNYNESAHGPGIGNFFETTDFCTVPLNVQQCQNMRPVVAYTPCDRYIVQWQYQGPCLPGLPQNHSHILVKKMDDAGNIVSADYEVSNFDLTTHAEVPSVCGRFVTSSASFSSTHVNHDYQRMMVKGAGTSCMDSTSMPGVGLNSESSISTDMTVYPNPADEIVLMETSSPYENYEICDMSGKQILSGEIQNGKALVDVSELNNGTYIVRFISTSSVEHQKLIIH